MQNFSLFIRLGWIPILLHFLQKYLDLQFEINLSMILRRPIIELIARSLSWHVLIRINRHYFYLRTSGNVCIAQRNLVIDTVPSTNNGKQSITSKESGQTSIMPSTYIRHKFISLVWGFQSIWFVLISRSAIAEEKDRDAL